MDCHGGVDHQFAYNTFQFEETLVTRWNLVCDQEYKVTDLGTTMVQVALVISVYMAGFLIGSFVCGWLGDKIGEVSLNLTFSRQEEVFDGFSSALLNIFPAWNFHARSRLLRCNQVNHLACLTAAQVPDGHWRDRCDADGLHHDCGDCGGEVS